MKFYSFCEKRTGKVRTVSGDSVADAIKALTIYPWAFEFIGSAPLTGRPDDLTPPTADEIAVFCAAQPCRKDDGIANAHGKCLRCGADHIVDCRPNGAVN